jgi:hypothetical protein
VSWQFAYGTSTHHLTLTPVQSIAAGGATSVTVSQTLTRLKARTKYHFRIIETVAPTPYAPGATVGGKYLTFTTGPLGKITLAHTRLPVTSSGEVALPVSCRSSAACVGGFTITAQTRVGHRGARHLHSIACGSTSARVAANHTQDVTLTVPKRCLSAVQSAHGRRLSATVTATPGSGQLGLVQRVTLVGQAPPSRK